MLDGLRLFKCLLPTQSTHEMDVQVDRTAEEVALLSDDSAYLAEKAQRRAEERERELREADARRIEHEVRLVREQEAAEVRQRELHRERERSERTAKEAEAKEPEVRAPESQSGGAAAAGAARKPFAFPQGGLPEEVETPRGKRSDAAALAAMSGLKLPLGVGSLAHSSALGPGSVVAPIQEKSSPARDKDEAPSAADIGADDTQDFRMRFFEIPQHGEEWDEIQNFDSDDLWSSKAFILVEKSEDAVPIYVWIGAEYIGVEDPEDEQDCHKFALGAVKSFSSCTPVTVEEVKVVTEGNEPDAFWDLFELG